MSTKNPIEESESTSPEPGLIDLSETLEDYLEIILMLGRKHKVVRVKEIAKAKSVRMPTVTSALRRLSEKGLVSYAAREYVELTPTGSDIARRIAGRHHFLTIFLERILGVSPEMAEHDACGLEHHLSTESLSHLAAFVEYIDTCKSVDPSFLDRFRESFMTTDCISTECDFRTNPVRRTRNHPDSTSKVVPINLMPNGVSGEVVRLKISEESRPDFIRSGFLPGVSVTRVRPATDSDGVIVSIHDHELTIGSTEAAAIFVRLSAEVASEETNESDR